MGYIIIIKAKQLIKKQHISIRYRVVIKSNKIQKEAVEQNISSKILFWKYFVFFHKKYVRTISIVWNKTWERQKKMCVGIFSVSSVEGKIEKLNKNLSFLRNTILLHLFLSPELEQINMSKNNSVVYFFRLIKKKIQ